MKSRTWENMTAEQQEEEKRECRLADELEAKERRSGYTSDFDYDN
ncbi:hypothetical protein LCGC14_0873320 [marine sediment metagenome]|uniref:Uncharacterized protein n=1 Tax=marine sediment metagenome TaxID=412755 RepID=A0A0F9P8Y2_9ZZZZ